MPNSSGEQPGLNLLSLDGGIGGLSSLLILKEIMTKVKEQDGRDTLPKPCELFDIIAGTGTGAISAVMLGRLHMDIDEAIKTYTQLMKTVFSECKYTRKEDTGAFKASVLERELKRIVGSAVGDQDAKMLEEEQANGGVRCKVIVYAMAHNPTPVRPMVFRSYQSRTTATRCTIWEALRATTAHPKMFKSIQVDVEDTGSQNTFTHGGLGFTNPTPSLLREARYVYPGRGVRSITSIGSGHPRTLQITTGHWLTSWGGDAMMTKVMQAAHEMAKDSERVAEKMAQRYSPDGPLYYRLNLQQGTQRANAGKWGRLDKIAVHTRAYLDQAEVGSKIDNLVQASTQPLKRLISHLPSDILVLIFELVLRLVPCHPMLSKSLPPFTLTWRSTFQIAPVFLSQVCSHWRRTAIESPTLWSRIDIQPRFGEADLARGAARWGVYAQRSGSCPLDIHIVDRLVFETEKNPLVNELFSKFIQKIAPRTRHLKVRSVSHLDFARQTLSLFMGSCVPGVLKVLDLGLFQIQSSVDGDRLADELFPNELPEHKLVSLFRSLVFLGLYGNYYPRLGINSCRELVELRLGPIGNFTSITESILVDLLKSNPRLHALKLGMGVSNMLPEKAQVTAIHVEDLQVVDLGVETRQYPGNILRWLRPGSKPLSLSMYAPYALSKQDPGFATQHETRNFIARSNVTKLGLRRIKTIRQLDYMLAMAPSVIVLAVHEFCSIPDDAHLLPKPPRSLDTLYVIPLSSSPPPDQENIQWFARYYDARELTTWTENLKFDGNGVFGTKIIIRDVHAQPAVSKTITKEPNPVAGWYWR